MKKKYLFILLMLLSMIASLSGCGTANTEGNNSGEAGKKGAEEKNDPVTLTLYVDGAALTDLEFQQFFVEPIQKKHPHITLQLLRSGKGTTVQDLLSAGGDFPDIIYTSNTSLERFRDLELTTDLNEYVKKTGFDKGKINPVIMESLALYSDKGQLLGLPYTLNIAAWFYNKDIFDRFGVEYPKDLMTWDQMLELARKLTRNVDGIQYIGMDLTEPDRVGQMMSLPYVEQKTYKPLLDTDGWRRVMSFMKQNFDIPGYIQDKKWKYGSGDFRTKKNIAMITHWADGMIGPLEEMHKKGEPMNWDWVALPNFPEFVGTGREVDVHVLIIPTLGKNKDQAWKVMTHIVSEEVQTIVSKSARYPVLTNPEIEKLFGANLETLKGKNSVANIMKAKPRKLHPPTEFDKDIAKKRLEDAAKMIAIDGKDVNTALREVQEIANKQIQEELAKRKAAGK